MVGGVIVLVLVTATAVFAILTAVPDAPPPVQPTRPEPADEPLPPSELGVYLFGRVLQDEWIHRRAESITFPGWDRVRRRVSLDIETPKGTPGLRTQDLARCIVPLAYVRKGETGNEAEFRAFEARLGDGRRIPILGRREHQLATLALLVHAVERLADPGSEPRGGGTVTTQEVKALRALVASPLGPAQRERSDLLARIQRSDPRLRTLVSAWGAVDDTMSPSERDGVMARRGALRFLMGMLSSHSILMTDLGVQERATRHVLEFVYEYGVPRKGDRLARSPRTLPRPEPPEVVAPQEPRPGGADQHRAPRPEPMHVFARRAWKAWKVRLGWESAVVDLAPWATLPCESHHLEVEAPQQMIITRARTFVYDGQHTNFVDDADVMKSGGSLAHVRQNRIRPMAVLWGAVELDATADHRGGWLAFLAATGLASLLALGLLRPRSIHQADAAATILVLVPGILLSAAAADVRHAIVGAWRWMFIRLVVGVGIASLAAAASIVSVPDIRPADYQYPTTLWLVLLCVTTGISLCFLRANLVKVRRRRR